MSANPRYLFAELAGQHQDQLGVWHRAAGLVREAGGEVLGHAAPGQIACLEPGTIAAGMLIARFGTADALAQCANRSLTPMLRKAAPQVTPLVLSINGLPLQGLPEMMAVPTVASVPVAPPIPRNALMVIRGSVSDQTAVDKYRDVILPMLKERRGYYEVFALAAGEIVALNGKWNDQIFAISRWPIRGMAEDFWYCTQYQKEAIPLRLGGGNFVVHLLDAV